ncbi:hypothetical protein BLA29_004233 [Euroglyphus maynei]|uniref:Glycerate kinase-like protein n=1 Tax=Euroglyphus maynei TaxID=6958 RepID=A0A1Y3APW8_EURMA|nr:hypothetical protein BLA29_004233 [Euroglyphus maynei]
MCVQILNQIFTSAVNAVLPQQLIRSAIRIEPKDGKLCIRLRHTDDDNIKWHKIPIVDRDIFLFGAGKAIVGMCQELLEQIDHSQLSIKVNGHLNIPFGSIVEKRQLFKKYNTTYHECGRNNLPDDFSVQNTQELMQKLHQHVTQHSNPLVIGFISGGGSALLSLPKESISLKDKLNVIQTMVRHGANIVELNSIRSCLSQVKHGKLAQQIFKWNAHSELLSFIISDIIGDPIEMIASGPTVLQPARLKPEEVLRKYSLQFEQRISKHLTTEHTEMPPRVNLTNMIIGSNAIALNEAKIQAENFGFKVVMMGSGLSGEARSVVRQLLEMVRNHKFVQEERSRFKGILWLAGGEVTIRMDQTKKLGIGGRCQEMGLLFLDEMNNIDWQGPEIYALFAGTDGQDGPTTAAGVQLKWPFKSSNIWRQSLANHDSYNFWMEHAPECIIRTGITGTNVMDIYALMIRF